MRKYGIYNDIEYRGGHWDIYHQAYHYRIWLYDKHKDIYADNMKHLKKIIDKELEG